MDNPWLALPRRPPFVLPEDEEHVRVFNQTAARAHRVRLELLPEPFLGNPRAPVVLLGLNPGFKRAAVRVHDRDRQFIASSRRNLAHERAEYPNHLLDPRHAELPGGPWWRRCLSQPIQDFGLEAVARRMFAIELFPYHSKQFGRAVVPSQAYTYHLLRRAIRRDARVIVMRGWRLWTLAVPELLAHGHCHRLALARRVFVNERTCRDGYPELARRLGRRLS